MKLCCHSQRNWLRKPLCQWYLNSYDSVLKHWLPLAVILSVIFGICRNFFKWKHLKNKLFFDYFFLYFWNLHQILNILNKKMTLTAYVIWKLQTPKVMVTQTSKSLRFITPFYGQHVQGSQTLVKSLWEYFHEFVLSILEKLTWKTSSLVIFELLPLFLKDWFPMASILFVWFSFYRNWFKSY